MEKVRIKFVHFSPHFLRAFQKLPRPVQSLAEKKDEWFRVNPFDYRLRTHKLKGKLPAYGRIPLTAITACFFRDTSQNWGTHPKNIGMCPLGCVP